MTRHLHDRSNSADIARHFIETQDGAPLTAQYIPAVDYVRQDFKRGTLARVSDAKTARRRAHRMHVAKHAALALAIGAAMWGLWG